MTLIHKDLVVRPRPVAYKCLISHNKSAEVTHPAGKRKVMIRSFKLKPSTVHERFGDETVILNLDSGSYYSAQGTGYR